MIRVTVADVLEAMPPGTPPVLAHCMSGVFELIQAVPHEVLADGLRAMFERMHELAPELLRPKVIEVRELLEQSINATNDPETVS